MSVYWYAYCPQCGKRCDAGTSHASGNFYFDDPLGRFIQRHANHAIKFVGDPDPETCPDLYECEEDQP